MNKKEAEHIAWEIFQIEDCLRLSTGKDGAMVVANTAIDAVYSIIEKHPKIKKEVLEFRKYYKYDLRGTI